MNQALTIVAGSALPCLMVLVGILLNRNDVNRLDVRISSLESSLRGEINSMRGELNSMRDRFHADMMMLMSTNGEFDKRIA